MTKEDISKELSRIQQSVPPALLQAVTHTTELTPTMQMVVDKALESEDFSEEKKEQLRKLKAAGYFAKTKVSENPKIAEKINNYINREIKKSIKAGRLPTKKQLQEILKQHD